MKKKRIIALFCILFIGFCLIFTYYKKDASKSANGECTFTDITWTRETESDTEYICFSSDGSFSYFCACGDPVNDSDLCTQYTYDEDSKTIHLDATDATPTTITTITLVSCDGNHLKLDFAGDIREFHK